MSYAFFSKKNHSFKNQIWILPAGLSIWRSLVMPICLYKKKVFSAWLVFLIEIISVNFVTNSKGPPLSPYKNNSSFLILNIECKYKVCICSSPHCTNTVVEIGAGRHTKSKCSWILTLTLKFDKLCAFANVSEQFLSGKARTFTHPSWSCVTSIVFENFESSAKSSKFKQEISLRSKYVVGNYSYLIIFLQSATRPLPIADWSFFCCEW